MLWHSPTVRLIYWFTLTFTLAICGGAAIGTGEARWIAIVVLVVMIALLQLAGRPADERPTNRLWDSPLTKLIYGCVLVATLLAFAGAALNGGAVGWIGRGAVALVVTLVALQFARPPRISE